jgi:hypothetical protein
MANTNTVQANLIEQLKASNVKGCTMVLWNPNAVKVSRGSNGAIIEYNPGSDLYDVTFYSGMTTLPQETGHYAEDLGGIISRVRKMKRVRL